MKRFAWKIIRKAYLYSFPRIMAVTVESAFVVSTMRTVSFTWNIISHFSGEQESHPGKKVTVERHTDKESYAGACDDLRIGVTMIFYLQNLAEYMQEKYKGLKDPGDRPVTVSGLASEGKILFPLQKDKEAVKVERELSKNRTNLIAAARNGDEEAMESLTMEGYGYFTP